MGEGTSRLRGWPLLILFIWLTPMAQVIASDKSVGKVDATMAPADTIDLPVKDWAGLKFIFLEEPKSGQVLGYPVDSYYCGQPPTGAALQVTWVPYADAAGKTATVIDLGENSLGAHLITLKMDSSDCIVRAVAGIGGTMSMAPIRDMRAARDRWLGKTIWANQRQILAYDAHTEKYGGVTVRIGDPLKVTDIWWGFVTPPGEPLWLIVETKSGEKGFISTSYSWTNVMPCFDKWSMPEARPWESKFFEFDPKARWKWSARIWAIIDKGQVSIGMTKEQVKMSWGAPQAVNRDLYKGAEREQWVYSAEYVYFDESNLVWAIQTRQ